MRIKCREDIILENDYDEISEVVCFVKGQIYEVELAHGFDDIYDIFEDSYVGLDEQDEKHYMDIAYIRMHFEVLDAH